ncbi:DUF262 domain-containing protein [Massilia arenae]|uniref:DUF262 domain-containing protein n=1 Tax=Massilia arenae TaxID=2603288 RepID=A0A5C7FTR5_9BURK|nr:DUF262 domain-containing protein [Massilia arenae]TXF98016.1 DUF262 domain-containing protein [Massilia arenae]
MSEQICQLSIRELLGESVHYVIPVYQRNYAWDEAEITQLIQDVIDYLPQDGAAPQHYYIGTLVVFERQHTGSTAYETIDGQQRLTTLSLLLSHLKNSGEPGLAWYDAPRIRFESRERSQKTFAAIFAGALEPVPKGFLAAQDTNTSITNGYQLIQKILPRKLKENGVDRHEFTRYLLENVVLMRVCVPQQTDLNHYFEIMNSRGEQLEKHEVLKARMMEALRDDAEPERSRHCLHVVWEACANMERYVQMGFTPTQRDAIFGAGDWGRFQPTDFTQLRDALALPATGIGAGSTALTLDQILEPSRPAAGAGGKAEPKGEEAPERFHAVINFPNFLLHVLRVMTGKNVPLDDKALIAEFDTQVFNADEPAAKIREFVFALLRCKYLFDHYVVKREFAKGTDGWSLKRLKWNAAVDRHGAGRTSYVNTFGADDEGAGADRGDNRRILMLLSAFHVSTPTRVYKHWLNAALKHLYDAQQVQEKSYLDYLESVSRAFVFDRYLAGDDRAEYFDIVYGRKGQCARGRDEAAGSDRIASRLAYGHIENNLVFNYLDYLLWLKHRTNDAVSGFEFTFRSSVEHYYPQNPKEGQAPLEPDAVDSFGNLCLISHSKNSRLSNFMPTAKKEYYANNQIDSIKQYLMMQRPEWNADAIRAHGEEMIGVLVDSLEREAVADGLVS